MRNILVILSFLLFALSVNAQTEGLDIKTIDGKEYYQYKVEKGNTLYSISKKFGVDLNGLVSANPEAEKGLKIGQVLNILKASEDKSTEIYSTPTINQKEDSLYLYHKAQQGETLYSIAKLYGVKPKKLIEKNELYKNNLPLNSTVRVPKKQIKGDRSDEIVPIEKLPEHELASENDSLIQHKVIKGETLYSISNQYGISQEQLLKFNPSLANGLKKGDKIVVPLPRKHPITVELVEAVLTENISITPVEGAVNVAVFAPFMLDEFKANRAKCLTEDCPVYRPTLLSLNYFHGVRFALDSLKKLGVTANVYVYDTKKDSAQVRQILLKKEFENMHLIFAPFFEHTLAPVLAYAQTHNAFIVNAVPQKTSVLMGSLNVANTLASTEVQMTFLGTYIAEKHNNDSENVVIIKNNNARDNYFSLFQDAYKSSSVNNVLAAETYLNSGLNALKSKLIKGAKNIVVLPSKDVKFVSDFFTKLNAVVNQRAYHDYDIQVYALGDLLSFSNIDVNYLSRFNTRFTKPSYVDYSNNSIQDMSIAFRKKYNYDPNRYVFASFEAVLYHTYLIAASGENFLQNYASTTFSGSHINYAFKRSNESGYENKAVVIVGFENNHLKKID